jgi:hypothetical protein
MERPRCTCFHKVEQWQGALKQKTADYNLLQANQFFTTEAAHRPTTAAQLQAELDAQRTGTLTAGQPSRILERGNAANGILNEFRTPPPAPALNERPYCTEDGEDIVLSGFLAQVYNAVDELQQFSSYEDRSSKRPPSFDGNRNDLESWIQKTLLYMRVNGKNFQHDQQRCDLVFTNTTGPANDLLRGPNGIQNRHKDVFASLYALYKQFGDTDPTGSAENRYTQLCFAAHGNAQYPTAAAAWTTFIIEFQAIANLLRWDPQTENLCLRDKLPQWLRNAANACPAVCKSKADVKAILKVLKNRVANWDRNVLTRPQEPVQDTRNNTRNARQPRQRVQPTHMNSHLQASQPYVAPPLVSQSAAHASYPIAVKQQNSAPPDRRQAPSFAQAPLPTSRAPTQASPQVNIKLENPAPAGSVECWHCKKPGHKKPDCPDLATSNRHMHACVDDFDDAFESDGEDGYEYISPEYMVSTPQENTETRYAYCPQPDPMYQYDKYDDFNESEN